MTGCKTCCTACAVVASRPVKVLPIKCVTAVATAVAVMACNRYSQSKATRAGVAIDGVLT